MRTLKERVDERESKPCAEQNMEKLSWNNFWEEWGPKLLLYACSYGSVDIVKLLVKDMACLPNYQAYALMKSNYEIVQYKDYLIGVQVENPHYLVQQKQERMI